MSRFDCSLLQCSLRMGAKAATSAQCCRPRASATRRSSIMASRHSQSHTVTHDELHWLDVPERVTYKLGCTAACMARHLGTSPTISSQPLKWPIGFVCVPQTDTNLSHFVVDSKRQAFSIVGPRITVHGTNHPDTSVY